MKQSLKSEITKILHAAPIVTNLARKNFVSLFVLALIQLRKVQFNELAIGLNQNAKISSNQNRIEPGRPLGLWAGNIPRFGLLPVVNQSGVHYRVAEELKTYAPIQSPLCSNCLRLG